jgi:FkbM family methyltransferase
MDKCRLNCELNRYDIGCFDAAVSDYDGLGRIYDLPTEHIYGVEVNKDINPAHLQSIEVKVTTKRLETFFKEHGIRSALLKIDVEYHLPQVVRGIGMGVRPVMIAEVLTDDVGRKTQDLLTDYAYCDLSGDIPVHRKNIVGRVHCNYLLYPKETGRMVEPLLSSL